LRNKFLDGRSARDIDAQVAKILRGLGNPKPPLNLDAVRELLRLDRQYFSSQDDGVLREFVSRAVIAGKQVALRPMLVIDTIRKWDLKALYLPDRKKILIGESQHRLKWRWSESHEVIHSVVPWHQTLMHGDTTHTLSPTCHAELQGEANYGAGRLLFFQDVFDEFAKSSPVSFKLVQDAKKYFGNTLTSCLWRMVEVLDVPALGIVSQHPHYKENDFDVANPCRYFIRSRKFEEMFASFTEQDGFDILTSYCSWGKRGPLTKREIVLTDERGEEHLFSFEPFHNGHELLTLIAYLKPSTVIVAVGNPNN